MHSVWLLLMLAVVTSGFRFRHPSQLRSRTSSLQWSVQILHPAEKLDKTVTVEPGKVILDAAEQQHVEIPYSCRAGTCSTCAGKLLSGEVDLGDQVYLDKEQIAKGYVLTCCATPLSDCSIEIGVEDDLF